MDVGKEKTTYKILFVPDREAENTKPLSLKLDVALIFLAAVVFLVAAVLTYCFVLSGRLGKADKEILELESKINALTGEKDTLEAENEVLQKKVELLSDTVNDKVQQEEEREAQTARASIPTGFPLKGTASYKESGTQIDGNPAVIFTSSKGTSVIPAARGTVSSIAGNEESGYIVMIDHGNGYYSVYRNGAEPKVKDGDEVTVATELFTMEDGHEELGYQIIQEGMYVNPLELMEAYG